MGRNKKITAKEVLEILMINQIEKKKIAKILEVTPKTVGKRVRELRDDGILIIQNQNGLAVIDKEKVVDDEDIREMLRLWMQKWLLPIFNSFITCANPTRPLLPTLKKTLRESLSSEERKELSMSCSRIKGLIDYVEAEKEAEED